MRDTARAPTDIDISSLTARIVARLFLPDADIAHTLPGTSFLSRTCWERRERWPMRES